MRCGELWLQGNSSSTEGGVQGEPDEEIRRLFSFIKSFKLKVSFSFSKSMKTVCIYCNNVVFIVSAEEEPEELESTPQIKN